MIAKDVHGHGHPTLSTDSGESTADQVGATTLIHPETGLPVEQCAGGGDHSTHNWNVYDPTGVKLSRVNPDGAHTCTGHNPLADVACPGGQLTDAQAAFAAIDWDARLKDAVVKTIAARDRRRNEREVFAENRAWGLQQRYRAKEARNRNDVAEGHGVLLPSKEPTVAAATDDQGSSK